MDRRHFLLGMTLGLGGGGVALSKTRTETETVPGDTDGDALTWETAQDWDAYQSQSGVVHEDVTNTDHTNASLLKMGYEYNTPYQSPVSYWPHDEDTGSTAYDIAGSNDASINGPLIDQPGMLGTSCYTFSGGDYTFVQSPTGIDGLQTLTLSSWFKTNGVSGNDHIIHTGATGGGEGYYLRLDDGVLDGSIFDGGTLARITSSATYDDDSWHFAAYTYDGATARLYADGQEVASGSFNISSYTNTWGLRIGAAEGDASKSWHGEIEDVRIYDKALSASEIQTLYDVVGGSSTLTTATKAFGSAVKPNLDNLDYSLNGQSITIAVTGSPGTVDAETVTQTLDGSEAYMLTWSDPHTEFNVKVTHDTTDKTVTPTINSMSLVA